MYGQWFSENGTRKLNKHWQQGEKLLGFFRMYHVINDGLSILMPKSTGQLSVFMKKSTGHLSVLMKKSTTTLTSKMVKSNTKLASRMVKSNTRMSINMNKITESGEIMYTTRGKGKFKKVAKSVATVGPFNIITNSGDGLKRLYDNDDLLSSSTTRFLGFQVSVLYCDNEYKGQNNSSGFNHYGLKNMGSNMGPGFWPKSNAGAYSESQYIESQPTKVDIIKLYNENCKHDLSQLGNSEYIGSEYYGDDNDDFNIMWLIKSNEMLSLSEDLGDDSVANDTEVGNYEMIMKISNTNFNATDYPESKRRIPIIGKSIVCVELAIGEHFLDRVYVFTPTIYDEKGKIATLKM